MDCNLIGAKPGHKGMSLHRSQNCWDQVGREARFDDIADRSGRKRRSDKVMIFMDRQKYDLGTAIRLLKLSCGLQSI